MKSKIRKIVVNNKIYVWSVSEIEWDLVCLKVWANGVISMPWFTLNYTFHNPWHLIGQIQTEEIAEKCQLNPITPKVVAEAIKFVVEEFGNPSTPVKTLRFEIDEHGNFAKF